MLQNDTLDYEALGIRWESEEVAQVYGENQSDKRTVNSAAQIAVMTDVEKFDKAFPGYILAMSDGTSLRVSCQRIGRKFDGKDIPANRQAVLEHLKGIRRKGSPAQVKRPLPNGKFFLGTEETAYRAEYTAALVDAGVESGLALQIAKALPW